MERWQLEGWLAVSSWCQVVHSKEEKKKKRYKPSCVVFDVRSRFEFRRRTKIMDPTARTNRANAANTLPIIAQGILSPSLAELEVVLLSPPVLPVEPVVTGVPILSDVKELFLSVVVAEVFNDENPNRFASNMPALMADGFVPVDVVVSRAAVAFVVFVRIITPQLDGDS
jgi:hypothetical protein